MAAADFFVNERRLRRMRAVLDRRQPDLTVLMDRVHKPHNLAAVMRSCDAVGVAELHTVPIEDEGWRIDANKAASGVERWVDLHRHDAIDTAMAELRGRGFRLLAAHCCEHAMDYRDIDWTLPTALLIGAELEGISEAALAAADARVFVPMSGMVESLNVSVATAVMLFEAFRQRDAAGLYVEPRLSEREYRETLERWCRPMPPSRLR